MYLSCHPRSCEMKIQQLRVHQFQCHLYQNRNEQLEEGSYEMEMKHVHLHGLILNIHRGRGEERRKLEEEEEIEKPMLSSTTPWLSAVKVEGSENRTREKMLSKCERSVF